MQTSNSCSNSIDFEHEFDYFLRLNGFPDNLETNTKSNEEILKRVQTLENRIMQQSELADKERISKNFIFFNVPESSLNAVLD